MAGVDDCQEGCCGAVQRGADSLRNMQAVKNQGQGGQDGHSVGQDFITDWLFTNIGDQVNDEMVNNDGH